MNPYTGLALKDEPSLAGVMIWNENDLTGHFGNSFLANKNAPWHRVLFLDALKAFAAKTGLNPAETEQTWLPGASKLFLNDLEYRWNHRAAEFLRSIGVKSAICSGHIWGMSAFSLPALTAGDVIDSHGYSRAQFLNVNPRSAASATGSIVWARLADRPKIISEYNMEDRGPQFDAFTIMPYTATMAAFQGWDAVMLYAYSQDALKSNDTQPVEQLPHAADHGPGPGGRPDLPPAGRQAGGEDRLPVPLARADLLQGHQRADQPRHPHRDGDPQADAGPAGRA